IPVHLADPAARLDGVRVTLAGLKESRQALGGEVLNAISEWTVPNLLVQALRLAARVRPYNVVVTNVPGPPIPLAPQGALMGKAQGGGKRISHTHGHDDPRAAAGGG